MKPHTSIKFTVPITINECELAWLVSVNDISEVINPEREHAYITPDNRVYALDYLGQTLIELNGNVIEKITRNGIELPISNKTVDIEVPTKTSDLENDSGYITNAVNNLVNYYTKGNSYNRTEINDLINAINTLEFEIVAELPTENISVTTIYLLGNNTGETDYYDEYIYLNDNWELIGSTSVDLTNYYTKTESDNRFVSTDDLPSALPNPFVLRLQNASGDTLTYDGSATRTVVFSKSFVGLSNVDNTSDASKPVSDLQQQALDLKGEGLSIDGNVLNLMNNSNVLSGVSLPGGVNIYDSSYVDDILYGVNYPPKFKKGELYHFDKLYTIFSLGASVFTYGIQFDDNSGVQFAVAVSPTRPTTETATLFCRTNDNGFVNEWQLIGNASAIDIPTLNGSDVQTELDALKQQIANLTPETGTFMVGNRTQKYKKNPDGSCEFFGRISIPVDEREITVTLPFEVLTATNSYEALATPVYNNEPTVFVSVGGMQTSTTIRFFRNGYTTGLTNVQDIYWRLTAKWK